MCVVLLCFFSQFINVYVIKQVSICIFSNCELTIVFLKKLYVLMGNCLSSSRGAKNVECGGGGVSINEFAPVVLEEILSQEKDDGQEELASEKDVVRRINEELAEFRQQLKQSQELFHALNNSAQTFGVTQSCPLLTDPEPKPGLVNCSTQTDERVVISRPAINVSHASTNLDHEIDLEGQSSSASNDDAEMTRLMENISIDGLDMESYRLAINLPTVLEESEQDIESSPGSLVRRTNSYDKGPRPKLVRMSNALLEDELKSDMDDYKSAASSFPGSLNSSTYNSLERPLQLSNHSRHSNSNNGRLDDETCSTISGENTTYGSPISSPSSPTYWTPAEGSSSQETLIHDRDGDKTPVNCDQTLIEETDFPDNKPKSSVWGVTMAIDNRHGTPSIGVIPETEQEHMKRYAFDTVARSCEPDAEILSRSEWRTLKKDLTAKEEAQYKRTFGEDAGGSGDGDGNMKSTVNVDLDDEAEKLCENYPPLIEQLFQSLDNFKHSENDLAGVDLTLISQRFENLALVFKTDHMNLPTRSETTTKSYDTATRRMKDISISLTQCLRKLRDYKLPADIHDDLCSIEQVSEELDMYCDMLSKAARRTGRIDLETRLCRMIEVMILYVHILKTLHQNAEESFCQARKSLETNGIPLPSKLAAEKLQHINNNNGNKVPWDSNEIMGNSELMERYFSEWYEIIRREFYWPWNWDQTWAGFKQGFAGFIMVVGLLVVAGNLLPSVDPDECDSILLRLFSILANFGILTHYGVVHL